MKNKTIKIRINNELKMSYVIQMRDAVDHRVDNEIWNSVSLPLYNMINQIIYSQRNKD